MAAVWLLFGCRLAVPALRPSAGRPASGRSDGQCPPGCGLRAAGSCGQLRASSALRRKYTDSGAAAARCSSRSLWPPRRPPEPQAAYDVVGPATRAGPPPPDPRCVTVLPLLISRDLVDARSRLAPAPGQSRRDAPAAASLLLLLLLLSCDGRLPRRSVRLASRRSRLPKTAAPPGAAGDASTSSSPASFPPLGLEIREGWNECPARAGMRRQMERVDLTPSAVSARSRGGDIGGCVPAASVKTMDGTFAPGTEYSIYDDGGDAHSLVPVRLFGPKHEQTTRARFYASAERVNAQIGRGVPLIPILARSLPGHRWAATTLSIVPLPSRCFARAPSLSSLAGWAWTMGTW